MKLTESEIKKLKKYNYTSIYQDKYETWWNRKEYWRDIQIHQKLSSKFIEEFAEYLDFELISCTQILSEEIMETYYEYLNWHDICMKQDLQETFIIRYKDLVDWDMISYYQNLSRSFLLKYRWKLNWCNVFRNEKISDNIKTSLIDSMN